MSSASSIFALSFPFGSPRRTLLFWMPGGSEEVGLRQLMKEDRRLLDMDGIHRLDMVAVKVKIDSGFGSFPTVDGRNPFAPLGNHGKSFFIGIYRGTIIPGFLRWCRISSIHSRSHSNWSPVTSFLVRDFVPFF